jgi:hypothetical protein
MLFELTTLVVIDTDCNYQTITATTVLCSHSNKRKTCINLLIGIQILLTYAILVRTLLPIFRWNVRMWTRYIFHNWQLRRYYKILSLIFFWSILPFRSTCAPPPLVFSGVRVTRCLVLCVCFVHRCLSFCPFSFGHFVARSVLRLTDSDYPFGIFKLFLDLIRPEKNRY